MAPQIVIVVDVGSSATGTLTNRAHVSGTTPDPNPANDDASDSVAVTTSADLLLLKDRVGRFVAGSNGAYRFRVENLGRPTPPPREGHRRLAERADVHRWVTTDTAAWSCTGTTALTAP